MATITISINTDIAASGHKGGVSINPSNVIPPLPGRGIQPPPPPPAPPNVMINEATQIPRPKRESR